MLYVGSFVELVVDVLLNDAALADTLVTEEHQLVLGLVACSRRREVHRWCGFEY